uniref:Uracil-DNA glycosylase n=1 Tax=Geladintestivirus 3 TaxID=3233135 RepID=A0AAU8MGX3_9CAUD
MVVTPKLCEDCALGMFNTKCKCLAGVGNPMSGRLIVVPDVDYNAYKNKGMSFSKYVEIVQDILIPFTGGLEQLDVFIVPLIRCNPVEKCPITTNIATRCMQHTFAEVNHYNIHKIMLLGNAAAYLGFGSTANTKDIIYQMGNYCYSTAYSPFVKFKDDIKYKELCNRLGKWYSADKTNNYNGMKIVKVINDS